MSAPYGNKNSKGHNNNPRGRPSLKDERWNLEVAQQMFYKKYDLEKVERLVKKLRAKRGKLSVREIMLVKALGGNERILAVLWDKVAISKHSQEIHRSVSEILRES